MNLTLYKPADFIRKKPVQEVTVRVNAKTGLIRLSMGAVRQLALEDGNKVLFATDPEDGTLYLLKHEDGSPIRLESTKARCNFNSKGVAQMVLEHTVKGGGYTYVHLRLSYSSIEHDGLELWPVLPLPILFK